MRVVQAAVTSTDQGLNPQISNPNDPWHRSLNYPLIWVKIGQALNLPDESRFIQFCGLVIMSFVAICAYILFRFPSFGLLTCLLSTATLLSIERGNVDLIIFSLVFVFALVFPRTLSPIPILLATMLKLYPVFLLGILLIKRQFILFFTSLIFALGIFGYIWDELALIRSNTPPSRFISYGFPSLALHFSAHNLPSWMVASVIIVISLVVLVMAFYFSKIKDYLQARWIQVQFVSRRCLNLYWHFYFFVQLGLQDDISWPLCTVRGNKAISTRRYFCHSNHRSHERVDINSLAGKARSRHRFVGEDRRFRSTVGLLGSPCAYHFPPF